MDAYNAAEKAGASALGYALECGKHLNAAKKDVGKGKWKKWCENNLPAVSEETERVYRRLAEALAKKEDVFAACKSIRDALQHLSGLDENLEPKPKKPRTQRTGSSATGLHPPETDTTSTGLKAELENAAADEIVVSIDTDKLEEVAKASLVKLSPDKVCDALTKAWTADQLHDLAKRVIASFASSASATSASTTAKLGARGQAQIVCPSSFPANTSPEIYVSALKPISGVCRGPS
jgi:hypothetical protein